MKIGYARVSTREQNSVSQRQLLAEAACEEIFIDEGVSGRTASRPELDRALARLRRGDTLVITRLSRLFRSLKHLISLAGELGERGVDLKVTQQDIDTATATGRLMFHLLGAFDEFNRELIVEGTREGLAATDKRGRNGGRPHKLTMRQIKQVYQMLDERTAENRPAWNITAIARHFKVSRPTIYKLIDDRADLAARIAGR
jgi:DNA invertase Pin-like site-specific DNA recombinase